MSSPESGAYAPLSGAELFVPLAVGQRDRSTHPVLPSVIRASMVRYTGDGPVLCTATSGTYTG